MPHKLTCALLLASCAGCATPPEPPPTTPVVIEIPGPVRFRPIPAELTRPCAIEERALVTVGDLYAVRLDLLEALAECAGRMEQIRAIPRE